MKGGQLVEEEERAGATTMGKILPTPARFSFSHNYPHPNAMDGAVVERVVNRIDGQDVCAYMYVHIYVMCV